MACVALSGLPACQHRPTPPSPPGASAPTVQTSRPCVAVDGIRFENVAETVGLRYRWPVQPRPMRILEAFGAGCAFLDYDDDGWPDILLVASPHPILYHNLGNGQFEDVTEATGLADLRGDWRGCAVGDYDGDGYPDLVLTGCRCLAVLHNTRVESRESRVESKGTPSPLLTPGLDASKPHTEGGASPAPTRLTAEGLTSQRRFVEVTAAAGFDPHNRGHWASSAGFMDLAGQGRLDLVLLNYVVFGPDEPQYCEVRAGVRSGCPPSKYRPEFSELWRNTGNGRFQDVTATSGIRRTHGKALVLAFADVDGDGRMDFYIGNDGMPAELMHNLGGMRFENLGIRNGLAYGSLNHPVAAMGADWADYDRDGRLDLAVSGFSDESYSLFHAVGKGLFELTSDAVGLSGPTYKPLGFGTDWLDMDNDGWPDLAFVNGHVYDNVHNIDPLSTFRQPMMLFHNEPAPQGRQLVDIVPRMGGDVAEPFLGRGSAAGDFDNDGRIDLLAVDYEGAPRLYHNLSDTGNHWITLDLRCPGANRFAYGAQVTVRIGSEVCVGQVSPACSYLSSSDRRVHFGLGRTTTIDTLTVRWPDGRRQVLRHLPVDRIVRVTEGRTEVSSIGR